MTKTPEEVVTDYIANGEDLEITGEGVCHALTAAGYVIFPKEPTEEMVTTASKIYGSVRSMLRAVLAARQ